MVVDHTDYTRSFGGAALAARLRRISERLDRDGTRAYLSQDVRFEQRWYGLLRQLIANGPMSVGEIAAALRISHASVSEARRSLEREGVITASAMPEDGRRRLLYLTSKGREMVERLQPLWEAFNVAAAELNEEAGDVVRLLDRLEDALSRKSMEQRIMDKMADSSSPVDIP